MDVETDRVIGVIGDNYERLALNRVMRNRNERMCASKFDYLMDINEISDIFSGHYEFQTTLFLATIIFRIMFIVSHSGRILGLNSYFKNKLTTMNKITASITTLLPIFLPATTQAAIITHGDTELHVNYYDIFMYMIQIMVTMVVFSAIVWICRFGIVLIQEILENYMRN